MPTVMPSGGLPLAPDRNFDRDGRCFETAPLKMFGDLNLAGLDGAAFSADAAAVARGSGSLRRPEQG